MYCSLIFKERSYACFAFVQEFLGETHYFPSFSGLGQGDSKMQRRKEDKISTKRKGSILHNVHHPVKAIKDQKQRVAPKKNTDMLYDKNDTSLRNFKPCSTQNQIKLIRDNLQLSSHLALRQFNYNVVHFSKRDSQKLEGIFKHFALYYSQLTDPLDVARTRDNNLK